MFSKTETQLIAKTLMQRKEWLVKNINNPEFSATKAQNQQTIEIITNQMSWTANTISELYKSRWQIEIFFREIKQNLNIKSFIGTSENAVMIQIWTALITILILKYLKAISKYNWYLSNLVSFIRLTLFVKIYLRHFLNNPLNKKVEKQMKTNSKGDYLLDFK